MKKIQDSKEEELALIREDMARKNEYSTELKAKHDNARSNYEALENITERYEGYGGSVQLVMEQKKSEKKIVNRMKNAKGINQYSEPDEDLIPQDTPRANQLHRTAIRIAEQNHISQGTVQKYAVYTRALEEVGKKAPDLVPKILSGRYKISHKNLIELSKLDADKLKKVALRIEQTQQPFIQYSQTRREIQTTSEGANGDKGVVPSVKDMPVFDPDAEITGLTLTIPSWSSSIERMRTKSNLQIVSDAAKARLITALNDLQGRIEEMLTAIKEE